MQIDATIGRAENATFRAWRIFPDGFSYSSSSCLLPFPAPFDPIIQHRRRRRLSPLPNEIFYVRRGGRVFGSIAVDEVGFILTRRRRHKTKWSGAIFHAESSPLVIVPFPRRGAIPCVVWYISEYIASEGCFPWAPKIPPNI